MGIRQQHKQVNNSFTEKSDGYFRILHAEGGKEITHPQHLLHYAPSLFQFIIQFVFFIAYSEKD